MQCHEDLGGFKMEPTVGESLGGSVWGHLTGCGCGCGISVAASSARRVSSSAWEILSWADIKQYGSWYDHCMGARDHWITFHVDSGEVKHIHQKCDSRIVGI